jgi:hypothetical protein
MLIFCRIPISLPILLLSFLFPPGCLPAQAPALPDLAGKSREDSIQTLVALFGHRKKLPPGYEIQALEALAYFPELKKTPVRFRLKPSLMTAKTRPGLLSSVLPRAWRTYLIVISSKTSALLTPISIQELPREAQTGLLGHELSHVADFSKKNLLQSLRDLFGHLSPRYLDRMEYHTDWIAIHHGLGNNLRAWSAYIRDHFHRRYWRGSGYATEPEKPVERYMNPDTIDRYMEEMKKGNP